MNNFDDLFEQRPQAEAAPQKQKSQKERPKRQWWQVKEEKHRKEAYATLDKIFGEFSEGTGSMEAYLDVQSRFPFHSARNALLIEAKCPHAERIHDEKGWKDMGVTVLEEEKRLPIIILEPGKAYRREDGSVGQNFSAASPWRRPTYSLPKAMRAIPARRRATKPTPSAICSASGMAWM